MIHMLDTDICIYLIKRKPIHVLERLRRLLDLLRWPSPRLQ